MGLISEDVLRHRFEPDWEGDAYQLTLYTLALGLNAQLIYEWGVGVSTLAFLRAVQRTGGKVVSCDINEQRADLIYQNAPEMLRQWEFHHLSSEEMHPLLTREADLIFIDGCHSYSCVLWEVQAYWPLLRCDGLMVLHDTRSFQGGPDRVAMQIARKGIEVVELPYSCGLAIIHKRPNDSGQLELELLP